MMNLPTLPDWLARPLQGSPDDEARERQANQALRKQCVDRSSPRRRPTAPRMTPELQALKDADGLERVRLGDCDLRYLRTPYLRGK